MHRSAARRPPTLGSHPVIRSTGHPTPRQQRPDRLHLDPAGDVALSEAPARRVDEAIVHDAVALGRNTRHERNMVWEGVRRHDRDELIGSQAPATFRFEPRHGFRGKVDRARPVERDKDHGPRPVPPGSLLVFTTRNRRRKPDACGRGHHHQDPTCPPQTSPLCPSRDAPHQFGSYHRPQ